VIVTTSIAAQFRVADTEASPRSGVSRPVNDLRPAPGDSGPLFSPQPFPPGLLGQRRLDSTLFDLRTLDAAQLAPREARAAGGHAGEPPGSGLIDIKTLVAAHHGESPARPVTLLPPRTLVALPDAPMAPTSEGSNRPLLVATCIALLGVVIALAAAALG
jgi:hypothetical protein